MLSKLEAAIKLSSEVLDADIIVDYVLMDTGFSTEPMIHSILESGLDVIDMAKQLKQRYYFGGKAYALLELQKFVNYNGASNIFSSLIVTSKKSECLYILSTNIALSDSEIVRIYENRWSIMPISG